MSLTYQSVNWNSQKKIYDKVSFALILLYLTIFITSSVIFYPNSTLETILIRAFSTAAFLLMHLILSIGPLCRLNPKFLPLLYNRRHLGVMMFSLALFHVLLTTIQHHFLGDVNPLVSIIAGNSAYTSISDFPFEVFGLLAILILLIMASTSHDFWLAIFGPKIWKSLHMLVYIAYFLIILHVVTGILQAEKSLIYIILLIIGFIWITSIHLIAAIKEKKNDKEMITKDGFVNLCSVDDLEENYARTFLISGERIAVFKYAGKVSAVSNVCRHQHGPLGEGKIIDGCITCPWHGYQYHPADGCSPEPFTEKIPTFGLIKVGDTILVNPIPLAAGTYSKPLNLDRSDDETE